MLKTVLAAGVAALGLMGGSAYAQGITTTAERCALIGPATERLACYDSLFRSGQFTGDTEDEPLPEMGMWASGVEISQIDGTERPFAALQSEQLIPALPRGRAPAQLTILCVDGETQVQFAFAGQALGTETSNSGILTIQFDRLPGRSQSLQLSPDRRSLSFFEAEDAAGFIDQLAQTSRLIVRAQPQGQRSATVSFQTEGIEMALEPVRQACAW